MSEETEAAEVPETHEHAPAKQTSGGSRPFLATLVVVVVLGGGFAYLWQQQQKLGRDVQAIEGSIDKLLGVIEKRHQAQLEAFKTVPEHTHASLEQRLQQDSAKLQRLEQVLHELRSRVGNDRSGWLAAEVEYLLRIAQHRLSLERDPLTAIAALRAARSRLELQDSPAYTEVIQQLGRDIDTLAALELPDREALANELAGLAAGVDAMPLATTADNPPEAVAGSAEGNGEPLSDNSWKAIWQKIWRDLRGLVTIRRDGEAERPLLVPEQRYFLRQNLQLKLESARLALLAGNANAWRASLSDSADWLRRYFDTRSLPVSTALSTVERLANMQLDPSLPTLDETLRLLRAAAMARSPAPRSDAEQGAPSVTQPAEKPSDKPAAQTTSATPAADTDAAPSATEAEQSEAEAPAAPADGADSAAPEAAVDTDEKAPKPSDGSPPPVDDEMPQLPQGDAS